MGADQEYLEIQQNEVEALKSIYMDDFTDMTKPSAWNKEPSPCFEITLRSTAETSKTLALTVKVTMTSTYPKSPPLVSITGKSGIISSQVKYLNKLVKNAITEHHGQEMIFEITSTLQEALDQYESKMNVESLEDQRLNRIKAEQQKLKDEKEAKRHQKELNVKEEERMLEIMVRDELRRRNDKETTLQPTSPANAKKLFTSSSNANDDTSAVFDRLISLRASNGTTIQFNQVTGKIPTKLDFFGKHYIVRPVTDEPDSSCDVSMLLTEISLDEPYWVTTEGKRKVYQLESELEAIRKLHHESIVPLYASTIFRPSGGSWKINLLSEYSTMGTVSDLLDTIGSVNIKIAKAWAIQLLDALEYVHKTGVAHKLVNIDNIALYRNKEIGETIVKLRNVCFGQKFIEMNAEHPFTSNTIELPSHGWQPPELSKPGTSITKKCDIFNFGVAFAEMIAGKSITNLYETPQDFIENNQFSASLKDFFTYMFRPIPKKRSSALDLLTCSFLRIDDSVQQQPILIEKSAASADLSPAFRRRSTNRVRRSFSSEKAVGGAVLQSPMYSRYAHDFDESSSLGKGAFGEVVKARNKLDGRYYAIKKIHATNDKLASILQEVWLLSRLNHQYVVRYFGAWLEDDYQVTSDAITTDEESDEETERESNIRSESNSFYSRSQGQFKQSDLSLSTPISFMSQSMHDDSGPDIEFGYSSCSSSEDIEDEQEEEEESADSSASFSSSDDEEDINANPKIITQLRKTQNVSERSTRSTLFIQMEYCEKHTLADLIKQGLYSQPDEYWRLFRQSLEALNHIHNEGVIHRDLKPMNIFIDQAHNVKIGDFGLAKSIGQTLLFSASAGNSSAEIAEDLTSEVGTTLYIANEMLSKKTNTYYDAKVDMYSMGIIFFEMVFPMDTAMERVNILRGLRTPDIRCPQAFLTTRYENEREIVCRLLDHKPSRRPSARDLLDSKLVPAPHKDEIVRETLQSIIDSKSDSPWISQVYSALFAKKLDTAATVLYDRFKFGNLKTTGDHLLYAQMVDSITQVFRRHGAVDIDDRPAIFPCSSMYNYPNLVKLMDPMGNILQMPYDLTLPFASKIAEKPPPFPKCFHFGYVYRADDKNKGTQPRRCGEIAFDIVTSSATDSDFHEAETIKVLDEIINLFPFFKSSSVSIYINHSDVLDSILRHCSFREHQKSSVLMLLGQSGIGPAIPNVKQELLSQYSLSATALHDWEQFGFRDDVDKAEAKLLRLMGDSDLEKSLKDGIANIRAVISHLKELGVTTKIYFAPLSNYNSTFYKSGIMFQVVHDEKKRILLAAGGRYDSLVKKFRHPSLDEGLPAHAVGFNMPSDRIMDYVLAYRDLSLKKRSKKNMKFLSTAVQEEVENFTTPARCDVLISSFKVSNTKTVCLKILRELWDHNIGADFVSNCISSEELMSVAEKEGIEWVVIVKQQSTFSSSSNFKPLRLKTISTKTDIDLAFDDLVPHLHVMISERDRNKQLSAAIPRSVFTNAHHHSNSGSSKIKFPIFFDKNSSDGGSIVRNNPVDDRPAVISNPVIILSESGKIKGGKKNRWLLEETTKDHVSDFVKEISSAPIYSLDVKDEVLEAITLTSPTLPDEWKRKVVGASPSQKWYIMETQAALAKEAARNTPFVLLHSTKTAKTCIYNLQQR